MNKEYIRIQLHDVQMWLDSGEYDIANQILHELKTDFLRFLRTELLNVNADHIKTMAGLILRAEDFAPGKQMML